MKVITAIDDAERLVGQELGVSGWKEIDQKRIDAFADVTEDHQWIHVDAERAATASPYGATVAHGFLIMSLIPKMSKDNYVVENAKMGLNYGLNRARFLTAVTPGSRIRIRSTLTAADRVADNIVNLIVRHTIEIDGSDKPAAVIDLIARYVF
jgi:acyl dehydratase